MKNMRFLGPKIVVLFMGFHRLPMSFCREFSLHLRFFAHFNNGTLSNGFPSGLRGLPGIFPMVSKNPRHLKFSKFFLLSSPATFIAGAALVLYAKSHGGEQYLVDPLFFLWFPVAYRNPGNGILTSI